MFCNSVVLTVMLLLYAIISQISDMVHGLIETTTECDCTKQFNEVVTAEITTSPSFTGLYQQSDNCGEILPRPVSGKEGASGWRRAWSARLHLRRTVGENQVGRVQRQPEERERREVRRRRHRTCGNVEIFSSCRSNNAPYFVYECYQKGSKTRSDKTVSIRLCRVESTWGLSVLAVKLLRRLVILIHLSDISCVKWHFSSISLLDNVLLNSSVISV